MESMSWGEGGVNRTLSMGPGLRRDDGFEGEKCALRLD